MMTIKDLLKVMVEQRASDLHLRSDLRPHFRIEGDLIAYDASGPISSQLLLSMLETIMPDRSREEFRRRKDADFSCQVPDLGHFRVNVLMDNRGIAAVFRLIPSRVPTADELGLPKAVQELCQLTKGLVIVTGPSRSGKSTTLAAMIDLINTTRSEHILTIEDPIEFVHRPQRCLITQRELHSHTESFSSALRAALREDPNIILVGDVSDPDTMEAALETAGMGHLVFGALHTNTAATTVSRIIDRFPANRQSQIRIMLADLLRGVIAQTLCRRTPSGRVAAFETLIVMPDTASMIRDGKIHHLPSAMQMGRSLGMQTLNDALVDLVARGLITEQEAWQHSPDRDGLQGQMQIAGLSNRTAEEQSPATEETLPSDSSVRPTTTAAADVVARLRGALRQTPESAEVLNDLAWVLATSRDTALRNAQEAVEAAEKAHSLAKVSSPQILDTLAAAYASAGRYESAIKWAREALSLATSAGEKELAASIAQRLAGYEAGTPVTEDIH